jgi:hypothetical protein
MPTATAQKSKSKRKSSAENERKLIETSLKRFTLTEETESEVRERGLDALRFSIGETQWNPAIKSQREIEGRPVLTVNRIPTFLRQYTGEERQHRPAMLVDPVGSGSDPEIAQIFQGALRHIEVASFADTTYDCAYDFMLRIGWSYWRINHEYLSDKPGSRDSFAQEPRIAPIDNPFSVFMSPIRAADGTDPLWCHCIEDMHMDQYKEKYPRSTIATLSSLNGVGNNAPGWVTKDGIRIAEYWWLELERKNLCLLSDGSSKYEGDLTEDDHVEDEREVLARTVKCAQHNAMEVLERYEWTGKYIPIIELNGTKLNVNGKIYKAGIVHDAIDPQRMYNYNITAAAEMVALAPKDPLYVPEGSLGNHEEEYRQANRKNYPFLYFKAYDGEGRPLPPPTRAGHEPPIQALSALAQQADYDLKSVLGIYEPGLGEQGPQIESGVAVLSRQQASDTGTVNYSDNLNRAIRWQGKILLDDFPHLITSARVQRIINPDDSVKHAVLFNSVHSDPTEAQELLSPPALDKIYDIGTGNYDVTLSAGPSYRTARQEAAKAMMSLVTAKPELFMIIGDLMVKSMDWPGSEALANRLKKALPPGLADQDDTDPQNQLATLQAQLQQLGQQHNQMVAELARATDTIRTKRLELESRERVANIQAQAGMIEALIKSNAEAGKAAMQAELDTISHRMQLLHESMTVEDEAGDAPQTPELPGSVEPKVQPITPAAPTAPVKPI